MRLRSIGAGATNQAIKATIVARPLLASQGYDLYIVPAFVTVKGSDGASDVTAVVLRCKLK